MQREFLARMKDMAMTTKERVCRNGPKDLSPCVVVNRGEEPIAMITVSIGNRDVIVENVGVAAGGFDADEIGLVTESYRPGVDPATGQQYDHNPLTGREWGFAEEDSMQYLAQQQDGLGRGLVIETLSVLVVNRAGDVAFTTCPFRYVGDKHLSWLEDKDVDASDWEVFSNMDGGTVTGGYLVERMLAIMQSPSGSTLVPEIELTREEKDVATAQYLTVMKRSAVALYAEIGTPRGNMLREHGIVISRVPRNRR